MKLLYSKRKTKYRVINQLRVLFPGEWKYDQQEQCWRGPEFNVEGKACSTPQHDMDDETCVIRYYRTDTMEQLQIF